MHCISPPYSHSSLLHAFISICSWKCFRSLQLALLLHCPFSTAVLSISFLHCQFFFGVLTSLYLCFYHFLVMSLCLSFLGCLFPVFQPWGGHFPYNHFFPIGPSINTLLFVMTFCFSPSYMSFPFYHSHSSSCSVFWIPVRGYTSGIISNYGYIVQYLSLIQSFALIVLCISNYMKPSPTGYGRAIL